MDGTDDVEDLVDPAVWPRLIAYLESLPEITEDDSVTDPEPVV